MPTTLEPQDCNDDLCDQKSALLEKANACILQGKIAQARTLMLESQKLAWDPRVAQMLDRLATVRYNLPACSLDELLDARKKHAEGASVEALEILDRLRNEHPESPLVLRFLGRMLRDCGRDEEAVDPLVRVAQLEPRSTEALFDAAAVLLATQRVERAELHLYRLLQVDANHAEANFCMARLLCRQDPVAACKHIEVYLTAVDSSHPYWQDAWHMLESALPVEIREALTW